MDVTAIPVAGVVLIMCAPMAAIVLWRVHARTRARDLRRSTDDHVYDRDTIARAQRRIGLIIKQTDVILRRAPKTRRGSDTTYIVVTQDEMVRLWDLAEKLKWDI